MNPGHLLWILFGPQTWGSGGNMVAWVICGGIGFAWLRVKQKAQQVELLAQNARHHREQLAQAETHHTAIMAQAGRHQDELLAKADGTHEAMKSHVTAVASHVAVTMSSVAVPQKLLDDIKAAPRKPGGKSS